MGPAVSRNIIICCLTLDIDSVFAAGEFYIAAAIFLSDSVLYLYICNYSMAM